MQPVFFFKILGIPFFSYTTCVLAGVSAALVVAYLNAKALGVDRRSIDEAFALIAVLGLTCGRIVHWALNQDFYRERPSQLFAFGDGGMSLVGIVIGGTGGLWLWSKRHALSFQGVCDAAVLPIAVVACGAWLGALMRGSQYGAPAENMLALELRDIYGVVDLRLATQLLAASWAALVGLCLMATRRWARGAVGDVSALFLLLYGAGMYLIELTRGDTAVYMLGLRFNQWLYVVMISVALAHIGRRMLKVLTNPSKLTRI